jgi:hypothetical protein
VTAGIPEGWQAEERADLRTGGWRFYRAVDPSFSSSVPEQNVVVRDGEAVARPDGVHALLADLDAFAHPPEDVRRLAEQVGFFVVEATSLSSGRVAVHDDPAPSLRAAGDGLVLEAAYDRNGAPWPMTITVRRSGEVTVDRE